MADSIIVTATRIRTQLLPSLRFGSAGLLLGPGVSKVLTDGQSVQFVTTLGRPRSERLGPVVGRSELGAAGLFLLDRRPRVAALLVSPVMCVAALTAGPTWQNLGVLPAALLVIGLETTTDGDAETRGQSTT